MTCVMCRGNMKLDKINYSVDLKDRFILIKEVPALVCDQCGEQFLENEILQKIEKIIKDSKEQNIDFEIIRFAA